MNAHNAEDNKAQKIFAIGDLIWTKVGKHPFWPCMVSYDPKNGTYIKFVERKSGLVPIYHVQYFGVSVQHGWTTPANSFEFKGEKDYFEKGSALAQNFENGPNNNKLKSKYDIPSSSKQKWKFAVKEAEKSLKDEVEPTRRYANHVFKYGGAKKKKSISSGTGSNSNRNCHTFDKSAHSSKRIRLSDDSQVCDVCNKNNADLPCTGICTKFFHLECLGIANVPENFKCGECSLGLYTCFTCKKSSGVVKKCSHSKCTKYYHAECLAQYEFTNRNKNFCPLHTCWTCYRENARNIMSHKGNMVQCAQCPTAFHSRESCIAAGSVEMNTSTVLCPYHFIGKKRISDKKTCNLNTCSVCNLGGELVCCEACPNAFHKNCLETTVPNEDFLCEDCTNKQHLLYNMVVWAKTGKFRWWPAQIKHLSYLPNNVKNLKHCNGEFAVQFFGTHDYSWLHSGRVFPYVEEHKKVKAKTTARLNVRFQLGLKEAAIAFDEYQKNRLSESLLDKKPEAYKHIQVNRALYPARIITDLSNISTCACDPSKENPCGLESQCINRSMSVECRPEFCLAKDLCQNQKFQKRQYVTTKIIKTKDRGWGLQTLQDVKKGEFIIEYVGEIITHEEYRRRSGQMLGSGNSNYYFLYLDSRRMIDAGPMGNYARFINHSCDPNSEMRKWSVNGDARIGIFAVVDISAEEELTFNYQSDNYEFEQKCFCSSQNCRGFIGKVKDNNLKPTGASTKTFSSKVHINGHAVQSNKRKNKNTLNSKKHTKHSTSSSSSTAQHLVSTIKSTAPAEITSFLRPPKSENFSHLSFKCSICNKTDSGRRVLCSAQGCKKTYHLGCHKLPTVPSVKWKCLSHYCCNCYQDAIVACQKCSAGLCRKCVEVEASLEKYTCKNCEQENCEDSQTKRVSSHLEHVLLSLKIKLGLKNFTSLVSSPKPSSISYISNDNEKNYSDQIDVENVDEDKEEEL